MSEYQYNYNQLIQTTYPDNPEMNVRYTYGDPSSGNQAGRLLYQEDATGMQQFSYGKLGEITKNVRTFVLPNYEFYTFKMEWEYDSWNRIKKITYPDEEIVTYNYDRAGMLIEVVGDKSSNGYGYLKNQGYDKFGNKNMMVYYNGIRTFYDYDPLNRRLQHLYGLDSQDDTVQNVMYYYDAANNITKVEKSAERGVGGVPYSTTITYQYDDLYRMTGSEGLMLYNNNGNYIFRMGLAYSQSGNISRKQLDSQILTVNGDENKVYDFNYAYQGTQPHALSSLSYDYGNKVYEWTPNGNMQKEEDFYSGSLVATRKMHWDEENRLTTLLDVDKTLNYYTYDAAGERTLKLTGNFEEMNINGQYNINASNLNTYTLYTSPYMVIDPKGYTKHYYIESDRFVSKIGGGMAHINYNIRKDHVYGMDINDPSDYEYKSHHLFKDGMMHRHFEYVQVNDEIIDDLCFSFIKELQEYDEDEKFIFFYHKDHLGSSTQISDRDANIIHHVEYMPSGEQFSEQRDHWATPYKFNSKELDAETGLYYYGARYYTPEIGIWLSVDPMSDKYPSLSPYAYCGNNPVMLVDPDGREIWIIGDAASEAFSQLQNKSNLKLSINSEGKVEAKGIAWTKADRMIKKASKDQNVKVNIEAKNSNTFDGWDNKEYKYKDDCGGAYGGSVVSDDGKVNAHQYVNPSRLGAMDKDVGDKQTGGYMLHEVAEGYYSGIIGKKTGGDKIGGSNYDKAHQRANRISGGGYTPFNMKISNAPILNFHNKINNHIPSPTGYFKNATNRSFKLRTE